MLFNIRLTGACLLLLLLSGAATAQPFFVPAPNIPGNATGVDPTLGVSFGTAEFMDFNADSHLDFIVTGRVSQVAGGFEPTFGALYRNFRVDINDIPPPPPRFDFIRTSIIDPVWLSAHDFEDIDGDGDLDLALSGATTIEAPFTTILKILRFDNTARQYNELFLLPGVHSGSLDWGDYDNDGDADLLVTGIVGNSTAVTWIVSNDNLSFQIETTPFDGIAYGDARFVDVDNDRDLDVVLAGVKDNGSFVFEIHRNDGGGAFSLLATNIEGVSFASMDWGDYDADGDLDLALSGGRPGPVSITGSTTIYRNDGAGTFTAIDADLTDIYYGDTDWIDYDRDGDLDLVTVGMINPFTSPRTQVNLNNGGTFSQNTILTVGLGAGPIVGLQHVSSAWGDFDEDNDLDLLLSGQTTSDSLFTALFGNVAGPNQRPNPPTSGLSSTVDGSNVTLTWGTGSDFETPNGGFTYNLRVGTTPGGIDVVAPNSLPDGKRQLVRVGNAESNFGWRLLDLPIGQYYWSVQAVDTDLRGSPFSIEQTFTIP